MLHGMFRNKVLVAEKEARYLELPIPGIDMNDVNILVLEHTLQVRGERRVEHEDNEEGCHCREA